MKAPTPNAIRHALPIFAPLLLVILIGFVFAYQFVKPAPPDQIRIASGQPTTEVRARLGYEVAFGPTGTLLGSFPNDDGWLETLVLWDPWDPRGPTGLASFTAPVEISCMYLEPAGDRLVTGDAEGRVTIWEFPEPATGAPGGMGA